MKELRRNNPSPIKDRKSFLDDPNLTYDEKVKRAILEGDRKQQENKLKQEKLKYGKFKTA